MDGDSHDDLGKQLPMSKSHIWTLAILIGAGAIIGCVATRTKEPRIESRIKTVRLADIPTISPDVVQPQSQLVQIEDPVLGRAKYLPLHSNNSL